MALAALKSLFVSKSKTRKQDILAFRTITTLLSFFELPSDSKVTMHTKEQQDELRVLDAMSTLSIRQYEVTAVTSIELQGTDTQVVASAEPEASPGPILMIVSANPRSNAPKKGYDKDPLLSGHDVSLVDPDAVIPEVLSANQEGDLLKIFLETHWLKESFATHTWMLKTLLRRLKDDQQSESGMKNLVLYVIATCHPKMHYRITNGPSPLYFDCLVNRIDTSFNFMDHPEIPSTRQDGSSRDQLFLDAIPFLDKFAAAKIPNLQKTAQLAIHNKHFDIYNKETYMEFHALLCELLKRFRGSLSDLVNLKTEDEGELSETLNSVLITGNILWTMARSAAIEKHLKNINHLLDFDGVVPSQKGEDREQDVREQDVWDQDVWEQDSQEQDVREQEGQEQDGQEQDVREQEGQEQDGQEQGDQEQGGEGHEEDTEFDLLKPYNMSQGEPLKPWQSYRDWLRLQTIYFDATEILARYVTAPSADISIKILSPSLPDDKMLSLENLLLDQRYFPDPSKHLYKPSGKDLFDFLSKFTADRSDVKEMEHKGGDEKKRGKSSKQSKGNSGKAQRGKGGSAKDGKGGSAKDGKGGEDMKGVHKIGTGVSFQTVIELVEKLGGSEVVCMDLVDSVGDQMKILKHCLSPEDDEHVENVCRRVSELKVDNLSSQRRLNLVAQILDMIAVLKRRSLLYHKLRSQSLRCGGKFTGTRHCEACIASLIYLSALVRSKQDDPKVEALLREFLKCAQAIGVSKRCCPVCGFLLDLLKTHDKKFIVTGEHSRISACTLPEWLPGEAIEATVDEFAKRLRKQLVDLYECEVLRVRGRSGSTDTRRFSMESLVLSRKKWSYDDSAFAAFFKTNKHITK